MESNMNRSSSLTRVLLTFGLISISYMASAQFTLDFQVTNACNGANSGAITIVVTDPIVPADTYTFDWTSIGGYTNTTTLTSIGALAADTYTVVVTRTSDGAIQGGTVDVLESAVPLGFNLPVITEASCDDGDGGISITGANGTGPYQYALIAYPGVPATTADFGGFLNNGGIFNGLNIGDYSVAVRDALGCIEIIDPIAVPQVASTIAIGLDNSDNATCNGANDGLIEVSGSGGNGNYTYSIIAGAGGSTEPDFEAAGFQANGGVFPNLGANVYDLAVQDDDGCIAILNGVAVTEPDPIVITQEVRFTTCDSLQIPDLDDENGRINILTTVGGTPPYTYDWVGPNGFTATGLAINNLVAGDYAVTVTDGNLCQRQFPFVIYNGFELQALPTNVTCKEADDGRIDLNIIWDDLRDNGDPNNLPHGQPGINQFVQWDKIEGAIVVPQIDVDNDNSITGLGPGIYVATVTDHFNCVKRDTVEITEPAEFIDISNVDIVNVLCRGESTGSITMTATGGGLAAYEYSIDGGANFQQEPIFEDLPAGSYDLVVRDLVNGCTDTQTENITEPSTTYSIDAINTTDIACFDDPDIGQAEIVIGKTDASHPITDINWYDINGVLLLDSSQPTLVEQVDTLAEGAYVIEVIDGFGCVKTDTFQINRPEEFRFVFNDQDIPCPEGGNVSLSIVIEGGTPNYTYSWTFGAVEVLNESKAGTTSTLSLSNDPANAGNYVVTVTDDRGCEIQQAFTVGIPDPIVIDADPVIQNACIGGSDGSIDITVTGGTPIGGTDYKYSWFKDGSLIEFSTDEDLTGLEAGMYQVNVTDANDCDPEIITVEIFDPATTYEIDTVAINNVICNGDNNGSVEIEIDFVEPGAMGEMHPTRENEFTYTWSKDGDPTFTAGNTQVINNLGPGIYRVSVNDNYPNTVGCVQEASFEVREFNTIELNEVVVDNICPPGPMGAGNTASITLSPTGGFGTYMYSWTKDGVDTGDSGPIISNLEGGLYEVTLTDQQGCVVVENFTITTFTDFVVLTEQELDVTCNGADDGSISIDVTGANGTLEFLWTFNGSFHSSNEDITGLAPGLYELTVTDVVGGNDCTVYTESYTITEPAIFDIVETITNPVCNSGMDGSISVELNDGSVVDPSPFDLRWYALPNDTNPIAVDVTEILNQPVGTYRLEVEYDATNNCIVSEDFVIVEFTAINPNATIDQMDCRIDMDASISLNPLGGDPPYSYQWFRNGFPYGGTDSFINSLDFGIYSVVITDNNGCGVTVNNLEVEEIPAFVIDINASDVVQISCNGADDGALTPSFSGGFDNFTFSWTLDGNFFSDQEQITDLGPGSYRLVVRDSNPLVTNPDLCDVYDNTFIITEPTAYTVVDDGTSVLTVTCNMDTDARISVDVQNGPSSSGFTYTWTDDMGIDQSPGVNTSFLNNRAPGIYDLTVLTPEGCSITESFEVIEYDQIVPNATVQQLTCPGPGFNTASIEVVPQGGNTTLTDYTYSWTRNGVGISGTTNSQTGLGEGTYEVTITDNNGCSLPFAQVIDPIPDYTITESVEQITCSGSNDGAINLRVEGGSGTITYQWELNGTIISNEDSISNLVPGDYEVTVIDDRGNGETCDAYINTYTITDPGTFDFVVDVRDVTCDEVQDGQIEVLSVTNVPGGVDPTTFTYQWTRLSDMSIIESNNTLLSGLESGDYRLDIIHDSFSAGVTALCTVSSVYTVINVEPITVLTDVVQNTCPGVNEASITLDVDGGQPNYTITWIRNGDVLNPITGPNPLVRENLEAGAYQITIVDDITCTETVDVVIDPIDDFIFASTLTDASCIDANDGSIDITISGGTNSFRYSWVYNGTTVLPDQEDLTDLEPGDYTLAIDALDGNGDAICDVFQLLDGAGNRTRTFTISEPDPLFIEVDNITQVSCSGEDDGLITVRVVDGGGNIQNATNFIKTWYEVQSDGSETEIANSNSLTIDELTAGEYRIEINDNSFGGGNGCFFTNSFVLDDNLPLEFTIATQQLSCDIATDGEIYVQNITGGTPTYNITWRDQAGNDLGFVDQDTITGLGDGTYIATVTDANLCTVSQSGIIIIYTPIQITNFTINDKLCFDSSPSEAAISLELDGGDGGDYIIEWTGPNGFFSDQQDISELEPGDYTVTINQATTCDGSEVTQTFTIDEPITVVVDADVTNETCFGEQDGSITNIQITINNQPTPPISENSFSYTWRYNGQVIGNSITPPNNLALAAGQYELEINDNTPGSCITTQTFTIEDNPEVTLNPIINQITCAGDNDASITVEPLGGAPDYNYQWYRESTLPADILGSETTATLSNRGPGTYFVVVTDQSGCAKSNLDDPYVIEDIQPIEVPDGNVSITQIKCLGETNGEIAINITGGRGPFDITWQKDGEFFQRDEDVLAADTAESRITNLADGVYTVTIDENSACPSFTASYTIDERTTTFHGGVARPQAITCNDASDGILRAVIEPDAGHPTDFEVEWFKDDDTVPFSTEIEINQLGPGTYRSEVTDAFGCMKEASVTLINPDPIFARAEVTELICNGAETAIIQLDPIGGYGEFTTTWSEASTGPIDNTGFRLAGIGAGEYNIAITDTVGCVKDTTILILDPLAIRIIPTVQNIFCQGDATGSIDIDVTEGTAPYTFQWRRDSTLVSLQEDLSELVAGNYTVRAEDSNGCVVNSDTIRVTEPEISFTIQGEIDRVTCNDGTDGAIRPVIVEEGGTSTYRFNWYRDSVLFALDTESLEGISPGMYTVEVEDANGCTKTRTFEIINPPVLDANNVTTDLSCFRSGDGSISIQPTGGYGNYTYEWSTGGETLPDTTSRLSNLEVGIYQCIIRDAEGCEITRRYQVNQPLPIIIDYVKEDNTCPGPYDASIIPTVSGGRAPYTFLWERGGEPIADTLVLDSLPPAEYILTVTDSTLCDAQTDPIIVEAPDPLGFNFLEFVDNLCPTTENGKISVQGIGGTSPYTFSFDSSAFDVRNDFFGLAKGDYALSVMDDAGCVNDTIVEIDHQYDLQPDFTYNFQELAIDYDISFEDQTVGPALTTWFWDFGDERASPEQDPTIQFESVGEYIVTLTIENEVECVASFSDTLNVEQGFVFSIPSGFSPNNDGLNDFFRPVFENITDIRTNIVDRNGQVVFTSNSREEFWDGRFNGDRMPQGPYYYEISYTSRAGKTRFRKGKVLLLR